MKSILFHTGFHRRFAGQARLCLLWTWLSLATGCNGPFDLPSPATPTIVSTITLKPESDPVGSVSYFGWFAPAKQQLIHFERDGQIERIFVKEKAFVRRGQVLARLQMRDLDEKAAQLQAEIGKLKTQSTDPSRPLGVDQRAERAQLETELELLKLQQQQGELVAPFGGSVWKLLVRDGQAVSQQTPAIDLFDYSSAVVVANLPQDVAAKLENEAQATIQIGVETFSARRCPLPGNPDHVDPSMVCFKFLSPPSPLLCRLEGIATVHLKLPLDRDGFWIPVSALVRDNDDRWSVMTINSPTSSGHQIRQQPLTNVVFGNDRVFVQGDLSEGDQVVAAGVHRVVAGQSVQPEPSNESVTHGLSTTSTIENDSDIGASDQEARQ